MEPTYLSVGTRTVGSVMCDAGKPAYRRFPSRPSDHSAARRVPGGASTSSASVNAIPMTFPAPAPGAARLAEAQETEKSLRSFDRTLRRSRSQSNRRQPFGASGSAADGSGVAALDASASSKAGDPQSQCTLPPALRSAMRLQPRLFSAALLEHNTLVARLRAMGCAAVLERMRTEGERLGMRAVTVCELCFLLGSVLDDPALRMDEVAYLFRFLDWFGTGEMDFKDVLASAGLLFCPVEMLSAVYCKRLLRERQLDDSVIPITDVDVVLAALQTLFVSEVPDIPELCAGVRRAVENLSPNHTVPVAVFCAEVRRKPRLLRCISWIHWDGTIAWPSLCVDGILFSRVRSRGEPLDFEETQNKCISPGGRITLANMLSDRKARNTEIISVAVNSGRKLDTYEETEADGDGEEESSVCRMDVCHPRFIADAHCVSTTDV